MPPCWEERFSRTGGDRQTAVLAAGDTGHTPAANRRHTSVVSLAAGCTAGCLLRVQDQVEQGKEMVKM